MVLLKNLKKIRKNYKKIAPFALGILLVSIPLLFIILKNKTKAEAAWWNASSGGSIWTKRQQVPLIYYDITSINSDLAANMPVAISINTRKLTEQGYLQKDCDDLRIVYQANSTTFTELPRSLSFPGGTSCDMSEATKVTFPLQATLTSNVYDYNYYVYYGNTQATAPTNAADAYDLGSNNAVLVCPFSGNTNCTGSAASLVNVDTAPGTVRYTGGKAAALYNGITSTLNAGNLKNDMDGKQVTWEAWINPSKFVNGAYILEGSAGASENCGLRFYGTGGQLEAYCYMHNAGPIGPAQGATITANAWHHVAFVYDGTYLRTFVDGKLDLETEVANDNIQYYGGANSTSFYIGGAGFAGMMDEVRLSNVARYSADFTPPTGPFVRDSYTSLLFHFDENGMGPWGEAAMDDSGNGHQATMYQIAEYMGGVTGINSEVGKVDTGAYLGKQGVLVELAKTNKIPNPSFENATFSNSWALSSTTSTTTAPSTSGPTIKFGSRSARVALTTTTDRYLYTSVTAGATTHTLTAYAYRGTAGNIGGTINSTIAGLYFNSAAVTPTYTDVGGGWYRMTYTATGAASARNYGVSVIENSGTIYFDGIQLEEGNASTYLDGSLGNGYSWDGTANLSTSYRAATGIGYSNPLSSDTAGAISFWVRSAEETNIWNLAGGGANTFGMLDMGDGWTCKGIALYTGFGNLYADIYNNGSCTGTSLVTTSSPFSTDYWYNIIISYNGTESVLYINGNATRGAGITAPPEFTYDIHLGTYPGGVDHYYENRFGAYYSDFRVYENSITDDQALDIYTLGAMSHSDATMVDSFTDNKGQNPVAIYHFDDSVGLTASDSSTYKHNLTLSASSAPTWDSYYSDSADLRSKSLRFNGLGQFASLLPDNDFEFGSGSFTISGWVQHGLTAPTGNQFIVSKYKSAGYKVYMKSDGTLCFGIDADATWTPADEVCTTTTITDSKWHNFSAVKTSNTSIAIYIDGKQESIDSSLTANTSLNNTARLYIGINSDAVSNGWEGSIDELIFYPYAKTADQIKQDTTTVQASALFGNSAYDNFSKDLVMYYKFDEGSGITTTKDSSGNGYDGTMAGHTAGWSTGVFSSSAKFDEVQSYIDTTAKPADIMGYGDSSFTVTSWVKMYTPIGSEQYSSLVGAGALVGGCGPVFSGLNMGYNNTGDRYVYFTVPGGSGDPCYRDFGYSDPHPGLDEWHYYTGTYDGKTKLISFYKDGVLEGTETWSGRGKFNWDYTNITLGGGLDDGLYDYGELDETRIYKRALTVAEINELYRYAPGPIGYWKMDENTYTNDCNTQTVMDSSGNGYHGVTCPSNVGPTQTEAGKIGKAILFDGNDDQVQLSGDSKFSSLRNVTASMWVKAVDNTNTAFVFSKTQSASDRWGIRWLNNNWVQLYDDIDNAGYTGCQTQLTGGDWYYLTATLKDNGNGTFANQFYVNGQSLNCARNSTGGWNSFGGGLYFGNDSTGISSFDGYLDDVRIYDYVRTPQQIMTDMYSSQPTPVGSNTGLLTYYRFDEGMGDVVYDQGPAKKNGLFSSTTTVTWTQNGKSGKAVDLSGGGTGATLSHITIPRGAYDNLSEGSISFWFKPDDTGDAWQEIFSGVDGSDLFSNAIEIAYNVTDNTLDVWSHMGTSDMVIFSAPIPGTVTDWHHVIYTVDSSGNKLYIDGQQVTPTYSSGNPSTQNFFSNLASSAGSALYYNIGCGIDMTSCLDTEMYQGLIDDFKIFGKALTTDQISQEYNNGGSRMAIGSVTTSATGTADNTYSRSFCPPGDADGSCAAGQSPGPIAQYDFSSKSTSALTDISGNQNNGTINGGLNTGDFTNGVAGNGISLDGTTDYIAANTVADAIDAGTGNFSIAGWFKVANTSTAPSLFTIDTSTCSDRFRVYLNSSGNIAVYAPSSTTTGTGVYNNNIWHHIELTFNDTSTNTGYIYIDGVRELTFSSTTSVVNTDYFTLGAQYVSSCPTAAAFFPGQVDEFTIYAYERTPRQVQWDYNKGKPLVQYNFDECTGSIIHDSASLFRSRIDGTINPGNNSGDYDTTGNCGSGVTSEMWNTGTAGKFGHALAFDGTNDYVSMGDPADGRLDMDTRDFSIAFWMKLSDANNTDLSLIHKGASGGDTDPGYWVWYYNTSQQLRLYLGNGTNRFYPTSDSNLALTDNVWHQITITVNRAGNVSFYVDGIAKGTSSISSYSGTSINTTTSFVIGSSDTNWSPIGLFDDVRVYNYVLTPTQIRNIVNGDAAVNVTN